MSPFDNMPDEIVKILTNHEKDLIKKYFKETTDLISGKSIPANEKQSKFIKAYNEFEKPSSGFEWAWLRFKILNEISKNIISHENKIIELENINKSLSNEKNQIISEASRIYDQHTKEIKLLKEKINWAMIELRKTKIGHDLDLSDLSLENRSLKMESDVLRQYLDKAYEKIRKYETELGIEYTLPEKFTVSKSLSQVEKSA